MNLGIPLNNYRYNYMKYILEVEIADNKIDFAEELFKTISFVKKVTSIAPNEITNPAILHGIEAYEKGQLSPAPINLDELKAIINA